jgi:hypothetical protein
MTRSQRFRNRIVWPLIVAASCSFWAVPLYLELSR